MSLTRRKAHEPLCSSTVIRVSSSAWALFLFDSVSNCASDCEGVIFGSRTVERSFVVTDAEQQKEEVIDRVDIDCILPAGYKFTFYDQNCVVDERKWEEIVVKLKPNSSVQPIGWFSASRGQDVALTERRCRKISSSLKAHIDHLKDDSILPLLLVVSQSEEHISEVSSRFFITERNARFRPAHINVINMGDTNDEANYWKSDSSLCRSNVATEELCLPPSISKTVFTAAEDMAQKAMQALQTAASSLFVPEVNTAALNPALTVNTLLEQPTQLNSNNIGNDIVKQRGHPHFQAENNESAVDREEAKLRKLKIEAESCAQPEELNIAEIEAEIADSDPEDSADDGGMKRRMGKPLSQSASDDIQSSNTSVPMPIAIKTVVKKPTPPGRGAKTAKGAPSQRVANTDLKGKMGPSAGRGLTTNGTAAPSPGGPARGIASHSKNTNASGAAAAGRGSKVKARAAALGGAVVSARATNRSQNNP